MKKTLALLVALLPCMAFADFYSAMKAYQDKDFAAAKAEFEQLAAFGNHKAQMNLGVMAYLGQGQTANEALGYAWFKVAADNGSARAQASLKEAGQPAQPVEVYKLYASLLKDYGKQALEQRLMPQVVLDNKEREPRVTTKPLHRVKPRFPDKAARQGLSGFVRLKFDIDESGAVMNPRVLESVPGKAFDRAALAAARKWKFHPVVDANGRPSRVYGNTLYLDFSLIGDKALGYQKYSMKHKAAAEAGEPGAQYLYALSNQMIRKSIMDSGKSPTLMKLEDIVSTKWYLESAKSGFPEAQYKIGKNLLRGVECVADQDKGKRWLVSAASTGHIKSQVELGEGLLDGYWLEQDIEKGLYWLEAAAQQGHFSSMHKLALYLASGEKGVRDAQKALTYADKALEVDDEHPDLLMAKAMAYAQLKQASKASDFYEEALDEAEDREWSLDFYKRLARQNNISF